MINARHAEILKFVFDNPNCSTNKVYIKTSPVCQRTGRTRSMGTSSWTIPVTLEIAGLIKIKVDKSRVVNWTQRNQVRYYWNLTLKGHAELTNYMEAE